MVKLLIAVFVIFILFIIGMAIGVFFGRKPIQGSCGGLGKVMGKSCPHCNNKGDCVKKK